MPAPKLSKALAQEAINALFKYNQNKTLAAKSLGLPKGTFDNRVMKAEYYGLTPTLAPGEQEEHPDKVKILKLQAEIQQLAKLNSELNNQAFDIAQVKEIIFGCNFKDRVPPKWVVPSTSGTNTGIPTLLCSDWHWDEVVFPAQVNHVNAFNRQIAEARAQTLFTKTVDLLVHHMAKPKYDYLVVDFGGDLLSGNIHEELRETNEVPITQSIMSLFDVLVAGLDYLQKHFKKLVVNSLPGNHGRIDKKPRFKNRVFDNYEWILLQFLKKHYKDNEDIIFNVSDSADYLYTVYNTRYLLTHGDQFKGGSGIAGALSPLMLGDARKRKRATATNQIYDYMIMGHWHQTIFFKSIIVNGSLKGYDEYAFQQNFDFEVPTQALWITHPDWGITARWPVYLDLPNKIY